MFGFGALGEVPLGIGLPEGFTPIPLSPGFRSGVSFPSYADLAEYDVVVGVEDTDYPISNLSDISSVRTVARAAAAGDFGFTFVLSSSVAISLVALLHHNGEAGSALRIRLYSDTGLTDQVYDTGEMEMFPTGALPSTEYAQVHPHIMPSEITIRAGRVDLTGNEAAWQIGAVELGGWWEWTDIAVAREFGLADRDIAYDQPLDVDHVTSGWAARTIKGSRENIEQSELNTTVLDFFAEKMMSRPFLYLWDYSDPETWVREAVVVTNNSLPLPSAKDYPAARMAFDLKESLS